MSLCARRIVRDWPARFGHEIPPPETFADPARFRGTACRAANWIVAGLTRGFARHGQSSDFSLEGTGLNEFTKHPDIDAGMDRGGVGRPVPEQGADRFKGARRAGGLSPQSA